MRKAVEIKMFGEKNSLFIEKNFSGYDIVKQIHKRDPETKELSHDHERMFFTHEEFDHLFSAMTDLSKIKVKEGL